MKQILRYLKPYLGKLLAATVLIALSTLCDLLLPTWMSAILNGGIAARDFPAIAVRCLQMLAIAAVSLASILGGTRLSTEVVACFCADLRADVFRKVNTLSFEEFGSLGTAALVTRATHDVDTVSWVASMLSGTVATIPMLFLGGVVLAMRKDVVLSLVLLAFVPLLTLIVVLLGKRVLPLWGKSDDYIDVQNALLRERLRGIRVIRAFNTEKREHGRIADATHIMAENIIRANVSMGLLTPLATLFLNISALLIIYLGGWRMVHGVSGVSAGDIFAIIQYVTMVMNGVIMASFAIIMYPRAQVAAGRIHQVLGAEGMGDPMAGETAELHGEIAGEGQLGRAGEIDVFAVQIDAEQAAVRLHLRPAAADKAEPGQRRDGCARSGAAGEREVLDAAFERQQADPVFPGHGTEVDVGPAREGGAAAQARGQLTQLGARTVQLRQHNGVRDARLAQLQIGAAHALRLNVQANDARAVQADAVAVGRDAPARDKPGGRFDALHRPGCKAAVVAVAAEAARAVASHLGSRPVAVIKAHAAVAAMRGRLEHHQPVRADGKMFPAQRRGQCGIALRRDGAVEVLEDHKVVSGAAIFPEVHETASLNRNFNEILAFSQKL